MRYSFILDINQHRLNTRREAISLTRKPKFKQSATTSDIQTREGPRMLSRSSPLRRLMIRLRDTNIYQPHIPAKMAMIV